MLIAKINLKRKMLVNLYMSLEYFYLYKYIYILFLFFFFVRAHDLEKHEFNLNIKYNIIKNKCNIFIPYIFVMILSIIAHVPRGNILKCRNLGNIGNILLFSLLS